MLMALEVIRFVVAVALGLTCMLAGMEFQNAIDYGRTGLPLSFVGWTGGALAAFVALMWLCGYVNDTRKRILLQIERLSDDQDVYNSVEHLIEQQRTPIARLNRANAVSDRRQLRTKVWWGGHWWRN